MKRIVYLFAGIAFILVSTIRCEKESIGTDDLQTLQQEDVLLSKGSKKEKVQVLHYDADNDTTITLSVNQNSLQAHLSHGDIPIVQSNTGRVWMALNLGASQVATSSTDEAAYGDLYQWGRGADGHQIRTSSTTTNLSNTDVPIAPNDIKFITATSIPYDWRSPQNDNLWQGVNGVNNPCPIGFRLPTEAEWNDEILTWSSQDEAGAFNSLLKLTVTGNRYHRNGLLFSVGSYGYYWSSTVNSTRSRFLIFGSDAKFRSGLRANGFCVRCIKDE